VQRVVLDHSGHVASLDVQRDELARSIVQFVAAAA
jgi:esterase/lipase